jgi:hypothetical protein
MGKELDKITISLRVTAVQMKLEIWMQGELEITINGQKPYSESDIVDCDSLLNSLELDGEYFIFSCSCGIPECGGWIEGIKVANKGNTIEWIDCDNDKTWYFDKISIEEYIKAIKKEVRIFKQYFKSKGIKYVGVGYTW